MDKEYQEAEKLLKYTVKELALIIENDGEDITCYYATALDDPIMSLLKAKSFMMVAEYKKEKN